MQLSLLMDETDLYSPIIRIVGTIVAVSPVFAIDSTLSRGSKKQRCERGYDVIRWTKLWNHSKQLLLPHQSNRWEFDHRCSEGRRNFPALIGRFLSADMVSSYNWLTRCYKKHERSHTSG